MEFKYKSKFNIFANLSKQDFQKGSFISKASMGLDDLKTLLPSNTEIKDNPDLLYTCFNAAAINLVNLNGDGMLTETALSVAKTFINKPMNIEHYRGDVIGFITNVGFSNFGDNKILTTEQLQDSNDPFNISLAAIVWKVCNGWFSDYLQDSQNERDFAYKSISASWEVGFNDYWIALGSKDLRKAEIVKDSERIKELASYLLCEGGTGFTKEGTEVYRVIAGDARFLGCAFTSNPASAVEGVIAIDANCEEIQKEEESPEEDDMEMEEEEDSKMCDKCGQKMDEDEHDAKCAPKKKSMAEKSWKEHVEIEKELLKLSKSKTILIKNEKNDSKISFSKKNCVIRNTMKYKTLEELFANESEATAADISEFVRNSVKEANDKFVTERTLREEKEKALTDAVATVEKTKADLDAVSSEINQLKSDLKAQADSVKFNERMASLKEDFALNDEASKSIAKQINGLEDEDFASWLEGMKPFLAKKQEAKASVEDEATESLKNAKAKKESDVPNAGESSEKDKFTKMTEAWTKGVTITV